MSFLISKIFTYTILSPGFFILLCIVLFFLILKEKKGLSLALLVLIIALMYFLSIEPGADLILKPLEDKYPPLDIMALKGRVDVIVILGGGLIEGRSPYGEMLYPGNFTLSRLIYGYNIWKELMVPIIVSGGRPLMSFPGTEGDVMKKFLVKQGVEEDFIIVENRSRNTWENALYTIEICKGSDFKSVVLVTSAFHLPRAVKAFSNKGITIYPAPSSYLTERHKYLWVNFFPHATYLYNSFIGLKEHVGLLFYKIFPKKS